MGIGYMIFKGCVENWANDWVLHFKNHSYHILVQEHHGNTNDIPENFDARQKWGEMCPSTLEVRDQGACGSCWVRKRF